MTDALVILCVLLAAFGNDFRRFRLLCSFLIIGWHGVRNKLCRPAATTRPGSPFVLPAWNEADVIGSSIDSLMSLSLSAGARGRIYVVDDASTDHTPRRHAREKMAQYPGSVFHLRREGRRPRARRTTPQPWPEKPSSPRTGPKPS